MSKSDPLAIMEADDETTSKPDPLLLPPSHQQEVVKLPRLKYGYRTTPLQWSELRHILLTGDLERLCRSEEQQHEYELSKLKIRQYYATRNHVGLYLLRNLDVKKK